MIDRGWTDLTAADRVAHGMAIYRFPARTPQPPAIKRVAAMPPPLVRRETVEKGVELQVAVKRARVPDHDPEPAYPAPVLGDDDHVPFKKLKGGV